jgi:hypothetical protein
MSDVPMADRRRQGCGNYGDAVLTRRELLRRSGLGLGTLALTALLAEENRLFADGGRLDASKLNTKAKHVILLFMGGGPSHIDTWDPKPALARLQGKPVPESIARNVPRVARQRLDNLYPSPFAFRRHGGSGLPASELYAETAKMADDICVIRSMHHHSIVHTPAEFLFTTGSATGTRPSLGSWLYYGLGSANKNLPGFFVFLEGENYAGPACWSAGFLPARYQGTVVNAAYGIPHVKLPPGCTTAGRRKELDVLQRLNAMHLERQGGNSELEARIESYELAFRMQTAAPEAFDLAKETAATKRPYGIDRPESRAYGTNCLLARRLIERGVRFVQLNQGGWDAHGNLHGNHREFARKTDRPIAGLLADLKRRGLLERALVVWGGEFGRTPTAEGKGPSPGRDHNPGAYTMWLAGGGVKGGRVIGVTDEVGYIAVERPVHPNDLHATILHALGIEQRELYFEHNGRRELVTFNGGQVVREAFA